MQTSKERGSKLFVGAVEFDGPVNFKQPPTGVGGGADPLLLSSGVVTAPSYSFSGDPNTGVFNPSADVFGMAAGGVEALRLSEAGGSVIQQHSSDVGLTADIGSAQGDGVILSSYNVYTTVATAGDAATLPAVFGVGTQIYIKNDGAESMDVFPASGDDAGAGADTAVAIAAGSSAVFAGTVANATWTQLIAAGGAHADPVLLGAGTVGAPTYSFSADPDTGVFNTAANQLGLVAGGVESGRVISGQLLAPTGTEAAPGRAMIGDEDTGFWGFTGNQFAVVLGGTASHVFGASTFQTFIGGGGGIVNVDASATIPSVLADASDPNTGLGAPAADAISLIAGGISGLTVTEAGAAITAQFVGVLQGSNAAGPLLSDVAAGIVTPTIIPDRADLDTGIGTNGGDTLSFIAGGVDIMQIKEGAGQTQVLVEAGTATLPVLSFIGDTDTGFYQPVANVVSVALGGVQKWSFQADRINSAAAGASIEFGTPTATDPSLVPNVGDLDTGIGWNAADSLSLVAGGNEGFRVTEAAAVITNTIFGNLVANGGAGAGPLMKNEGPSSTNPTLCPNQADDDTGLGRDAVDSLSLIAGGLGCLRVREIAAARAIGFYTTTPIIQQTGIAVTAGGIHAALVNLGLFTA